MMYFVPWSSMDFVSYGHTDMLPSISHTRKPGFNQFTLVLGSCKLKLKLFMVLNPICFLFTGLLDLSVR